MGWYGERGSASLGLMGAWGRAPAEVQGAEPPVGGAGDEPIMGVWGRALLPRPKS